MARVLIVDDDGSLVELVSVWLRKAGHQTAVAGSAAQALQVVAERGEPDVAVLDVDMPETDGLALADRFRAEGRRFPVVFLTAKVQPDDVEAGRARGAIYLTKPFVASALLNAIDRALPDDLAW